MSDRDAKGWVMVTFFFIGVICGLVGKDALCIFMGIIITGEIIGQYITAKTPR